MFRKWALGMTIYIWLDMYVVSYCGREKEAVMGCPLPPSAGPTRRRRRAGREQRGRQGAAALTTSAIPPVAPTPHPCHVPLSHPLDTTH